MDYKQRRQLPREEKSDVDRNTLILVDQSWVYDECAQKLVDSCLIRIWVMEISVSKKNKKIETSGFVQRVRCMMPESPFVNEHSAWQVVYYKEKLHFLGGLNPLSCVYDFRTGCFEKKANTPVCNASFLAIKQGLICVGGSVPSLDPSITGPQTRLLYCPNCYEGVFKVNYTSQQRPSLEKWKVDICNNVCGVCFVRASEFRKEQFFPYYFGNEGDALAPTSDVLRVSSLVPPRNAPSYMSRAAESRVTNMNGERHLHVAVENQGRLLLLGGVGPQPEESVGGSSPELGLEIISGLGSDKPVSTTLTEERFGPRAGHFAVAARHLRQEGGTYAFTSPLNSIMKHFNLFSPNLALRPRAGAPGDKTLAFPVSRTHAREEGESKEILDYIYVGGSQRKEDAACVERFSIEYVDKKNADDESVENVPVLGPRELLPKLNRPRAFASAFVLRGLPNRVFVGGGVNPKTMKANTSVEFLDFYGKNATAWSYEPKLSLPTDSLSYFQLICV